jgi:hypothetical protein
MSHYRNLGGGRRDKNEPEIMQRFRYHGWHPEQVSGNRLWDLNVYPSKPTMTGTNNPCFTLVCHVDVKGPKGKVEDAQREKWKALAEKGIPVYVCRAEADVDALVRGVLEPWRPEPACDCGYIVGRLKTNGGHKDTCATRPGVATPGRRVPKGATEERARQKRHTAQYGPPQGTTAQRLASAQREYEASPHYTPPSSTPVDAAKEAAETFAPLADHALCIRGGCGEPAAYGRAWCPEHTP